MKVWSFMLPNYSPSIFLWLLQVQVHAKHFSIVFKIGIKKDSCFPPPTPPPPRGESRSPTSLQTSFKCSECAPDETKLQRIHKYLSQIQKRLILHYMGLHNNVGFGVFFNVLSFHHTNIKNIDNNVSKKVGLLSFKENIKAENTRRNQKEC